MTEPPGTGVPESAATPPPKRQGMGRSTALMASGTIVSRVLGFARNALLVAAIGVNAGAANAFEVANKIPNALYAVLAAGVLNAALVPQIVRAFSKPDGKTTVDRILTIGATVSLGATVVFTASAGIWVRVYSDDWSPELTALATAFALWCIPQLFFYGIYTLLGQVLNARGQFGPFMWAPALNNVIGIAGLIAYLALFGQYVTPDPGGVASVLNEQWSAERIALLAGVATAGIAAQAAILVWPLLRGGYRWRWRWSGPKGELRSVRVVASWALGAVLVEQVAVALVSRVATAANPGDLDPAIAGNAAYYNAMILYLVPHSVVTVSIITVLFTSISRLHASGDRAGVRSAVGRGMRLIGVFTILATAVLVVLAPFIVRIALPSESPIVVESVAEVLVTMSLGLVPLGAMVLMKYVFFALEDARSIFYIHIPMAIVWIATAWLGRELVEPRWWVVWVAAGMVASNVVALVLRLGTLRRKLGGIDGRRLAVVHLKSLVAGAVAFAAGWGATRVLPELTELNGWGGIGVAAAICVVVGLAMTAVYTAILLLWNVGEVRDIARQFRSRLQRRVR